MFWQSLVTVNCYNNKFWMLYTKAWIRLSAFLMSKYFRMLPIRHSARAANLQMVCIYMYYFGYLLGVKNLIFHAHLCITQVSFKGDFGNFQSASPSVSTLCCFPFLPIFQTFSSSGSKRRYFFQI